MTSSSSIIDNTIIDSHPTTIVCHRFADAIHVICTQRRRPGCLVTPTRALLRSRDTGVAQIVARRLTAALESRQDARRVLVSLALLNDHSDADHADDDAQLNAIVAPIVTAITQVLLPDSTDKQ